MTPDQIAMTIVILAFIIFIITFITWLTFLIVTKIKTKKAIKNQIDYK